MERTLILATVVVPVFTALLHAWIFAAQRRGSLHLSFAAAALAMAVIAGAVIAQGLAVSPEHARLSQRVQIAAGAILLFAFVRWVHDFSGRRRPHVDFAAACVATAVLVATAAGLIFEPDATLRPTLVFHPPGWEAPVSPIGLVLLSGFAVGALYIGVELRRAAQLDLDTRAAFLAYVGFGAAILHDCARGTGWIERPALLSFGYLIMVVGISATLIQRFVRSTERAEYLASKWQELGEERSAALRRKELQLVHGERLATLGTLASGVAHELNDPMAFVSSNLNRVEEIWNHPEGRSDVPEILAECRDGLARLRSTVDELLRLARGSDAESVPTDVTEVVASVLRLVRGEARFRAQLECDFSPVPAVFGNPALLAQVALQLLLNGIRSGPENGSGRHRVDVTTRYEAGWVLLRVRDDGPAMAPELLPRLFDPFAGPPDGVAADGVLHARLGLAVTHQIVSRHGGRLEVDSGSQGNVFTVALPALETAADEELRAVS
jgi:signal transduction histidine kinase